MNAIDVTARLEINKYVWEAGSLYQQGHLTMVVVCYLSQYANPTMFNVPYRFSVRLCSLQEFLVSSRQPSILLPSSSTSSSFFFFLFSSKKKQWNSTSIKGKTQSWLGLGVNLHDFINSDARIRMPDIFLIFKVPLHVAGGLAKPKNG